MERREGRCGGGGGEGPGFDFGPYLSPWDAHGWSYEEEYEYYLGQLQELLKLVSGTWHL